MSKNKKSRNAVGVVYSTNPDYQYQYDDSDEQLETLPPAKQRLHVRMERSGRGGKTVTVVDNFVGSDDDLQALGRTLKTKCGVGGTAKDGQIIIQGDFRERIVALLREMGYPVK
jgi:translation initiation factor 1